ncbi:MAG TPA: hypothetical protein VMH30_08950 [Verrucomicrobiae bacterium]|nr:hypothetical protein [Verrucomicrobiae bacterium]
MKNIKKLIPLLAVPILVAGCNHRPNTGTESTNTPASNEMNTNSSGAGMSANTNAPTPNMGATNSAATTNTPP